MAALSAARKNDLVARDLQLVFLFLHTRVVFATRLNRSLAIPPSLLVPLTVFINISLPSLHHSGQESMYELNVPSDKPPAEEKPEAPLLCMRELFS